MDDLDPDGEELTKETSREKSEDFLTFTENDLAGIEDFNNVDFKGRLVSLLVQC